MTNIWVWFDTITFTLHVIYREISQLIYWRVMSIIVLGKNTFFAYRTNDPIYLSVLPTSCFCCRNLTRKCELIRTEKVKWDMLAFLIITIVDLFTQANKKSVCNKPISVRTHFTCATQVVEMPLDLFLPTPHFFLHKLDTLLSPPPLPT